MRNRTVALLIILQVIRAHSTSPSSTTNRSNEMVDENIACTVRNHEEATMMSSLVRMNRSRNEESEMYAQQRAYNDCATNAMFGKFSSGAQCCTKEKRIEPIKNLENGLNYERRTFPRETESMSDGISHMLRFTPNFTFVQNVECQEQVNIFLRELRNYKLWAMEMLDSNAKLPSGLLQGNLNQFGDFDQCLNVIAHEKSNGRMIKMQGRYFLTNIDINATHPIMENPVFRMKVYNILTSRLHEKGRHFFPRFPVIRWALCLPSACSNEDARSIIQHALNGYNSTAGIKFIVHVDSNMNYVKHESSSYTKETTYVLCFFAIVACLVAAITTRDYLMAPRGEKEKENSLERIAMGFSLRRSARSLFKRGTGDNDISCVHGMKSILAILIYMGHKIMITSIIPYKNRIHYMNSASHPLTVIVRIATMYTDSFLLFSGMFVSYNMMHELTVKGEIRWFKRLVSRYVRLTPPLLATVLYYAYVMEHTGSGPEWNIMVENADLCKRTGWMNLLYAQLILPFEDQCASHTYQLSVDMQLSLLAPLLVYVLNFWPTLGILLVLFTASLSTIFRYTILMRNNVAMIIHHGFSTEEFYNMCNNIYILPFYRITPYICGVAFSVLLYRVGKNVKIPKIVMNIGWLVSTMIIIWTLFSQYNIGNKDYVMDVKALTNFVVFYQILWILAHCWIVFVCHTNNGGAVNRFLSHHWFVVFSKISYSFYLIQFVYFFYDVATIRYPDTFQILKLINGSEFASLLFWSIVLTLTFDIPMQEVKNYIMRK